MALQTSSGTLRERWIKALLPAAAIVSGYMVVFNLGNAAELRDLQKELDRKRQSAVSENELASIDAHRRSALQQRDELNDQIEAVRESIDQQLAEFRLESAAERMVEIGDLCQELSIGLLAQQPAANPELSEIRERSVGTLREKLSDRPLTYRQLELVGRYADVAELLEQLPETIRGVIPVGIELVEPADGPENAFAAGQRQWRLYVLM